MVWWRRKPPPMPPQGEWDADASLAEADRALARAGQQRREQNLIAKTLREVRERNHLAELFGHDGMGA
jgi:hypothetical protein